MHHECSDRYPRGTGDMESRGSQPDTIMNAAATTRTYERIANELLQLRNEAKSLDDEKLRLALENAYFEAVAARRVTERGSPGPA